MVFALENRMLEEVYLNWNFWLWSYLECATALILTRLVTPDEVKESMFAISKEVTWPERLCKWLLQKEMGDYWWFNYKSQDGFFFSNGKLLHQVNATNLVLIPRIQNHRHGDSLGPLQVVIQFRSASLKLFVKNSKPLFAKNSKPCFLSWVIHAEMLSCLVEN